MRLRGGGVTCGMTAPGRSPFRNPVLWGLSLAAVGIRWFSSDPSRVEDWYSGRFYPPLSRLMRGLTGPIPLSLGDVFYGFLAVWLVWLAFRAVRTLRREGWGGLFNMELLGRTLTVLLAFYVAFNLSWGLNYDRLGIAHQLGLEPEVSDTADLQGLTEELLLETNRYAAASDRLRRMETDDLLRRTLDAYREAVGVFPFLGYRPHSVKASLFGALGNHLGYTGYYNPFSAEAQLNDAIPRVLKPFVLCHEVAHQLGYAHESEANFVGFLAARSSKDSAFLYSAYFDMFLYANGALYAQDSAQSRRNLTLLDTAARRDLAELRAFRLRYQGPVERFIDVVYDRFLKWNRQPQGRASYSQVVRWLLAYRRKEGGI
jgi:hypothetical protein